MPTSTQHEHDPRTPEDDTALADLVESGDLPAIREWLTEHPAHEIADALGRMTAVEAAVAFRLLGKGEALDIFEELDPEDQQGILEGLRDKEFLDLIEEMDPDDRAQMLDEAPAKVAARVLGGLSARERQMTAALLGYPEGSVGRRMTPELVTLPMDLTVGQAVSRVRERGARAESIYTLPVVDRSRQLRGVVNLRELVLADMDAPVADLVVTEPAYVRATDEAEVAARLMQETNDLNLPVVDSENRLVGLFTFDDAVEVIEEADSEDVARQSGSTPWSGHYMAVGVWKLARTRALWLSLLLVAATLTVTVTQAFEATLEEVAALALFIPMLIGAGGNAGAQAATACVRALAVGEVRGSDLLRVIWREARVGLLLGALLAALGMVVGALFVSFDIAVVVGITLVLICGWAASVGGSMPLLAKKLGIDPAVVSAPMVTTLVDATGLLIYFGTAMVVLGL